jgi:hypothetical protein
VEFEIEVEEENPETKVMENIKKKVNLRKPIFEHRMEYLKVILPMQNELVAFQKAAKSGSVENPEEGMNKLNKFYEARFSLLFKLHDRAVFKQPAEFGKVAGSDIEKMCNWMEGEMGAHKTEVEESFLPNSGK